MIKYVFEGNLDGVKSEYEGNSQNILNMALLYSSERGCDDITYFLIEKGADIHTEDEQILFDNIKYDNFELVEYLVAKGANVNARNGVLTYCAKHRRLKLMFFLLLKGATDLDGALICSTQQGDLGIVQFLIEHGADVRAVNIYALRYGAMKGFLNVTYFLIENGAIKDPHALFYSIYYNHHNGVDYLLSIYSFEELKKDLKNDHLKRIAIKYICKRGLNKYGTIINAFREIGVDVFDLLEKEFS